MCICLGVLCTCVLYVVPVCMCPYEVAALRWEGVGLWGLLFAVCRTSQYRKGKGLVCLTHCTLTRDSAQH